jgi:hypothetical protein
MRMAPRLIALTAALTLVVACGGQHQGPGEASPGRPPEAAIAARATAERTALAGLGGEPDAEKQILFGDLHVHTTFSADAFMRSLPMLEGEGVHPPADACDFARFCSALDFWSINDHAEGLTPQHWQETKDAIRQCNALAGDPKNPDIVSFLGWEWTQVGQTAADHYGHKNVILRHTDDDKIPVRPVAALSPQLIATMQRQPPLWQRLQFPLFDWPNRQRYFDLARFIAELRETPICPKGVDVHDLPADCIESADTPSELFEKLAQWNYEAMVIPHGNTWGFYTPPGSSWDKQLVGNQHDPSRQFLIEVYSGHGNSEEYRPWETEGIDAQGNPICPAPTKEYLPCCWQAGEIVRKRCGDIPAEECERRVVDAQRNFIQAGVAGRQTQPWASAEEWLDCGQCRDCFLPAFNTRPKSSAQYALAISNFDDPAKEPRRFRFGFIGSSDNHSARGGTGYKEFGRRMNTETAGPKDEAWRRRILGDTPAPQDESKPFVLNVPGDEDGPMAFQILDMERQASFFLTGGLVAVHAAGRDRDSIWDALQRKEVYATSGPRILLWFDLLNGPNGVAPMGSEVTLATAPRFRVRASGSFVQNPGCPDWATAAVGAERLEHLCRGECYNPSDARHRITRIEIVRIRPQTSPGEDVAGLIDDPWKRIECPAGAGCVAEFEDPEYVAGDREFIYYARAIQEPTPAVNGGGLRCQYDDSGACVSVNPCYGDYRTPSDDDCLGPAEERAWSSPIFVRR